MVTRSDLRLAGSAALLTGALLTASLLLFQGGPPSSHPNAVLAWHTANAAPLKLIAVVWLLAMLALVGFAIGLREGMWATILDRSWMTVLFVQGAGIFATWGLTAPLIVTGAALAQHSVLGQVCAVAAVLVAIALVVPLTWGVALYAFAGWLALAGVTLLSPWSSRVREPAPVS